MRTRDVLLLLFALAACAREEAPAGRIANVKIVADDAVKAAEAVMKTAEAAGGSVTRTRIWREGDVLRATLVLQVPSEKLTPTLAAIHEMAERVEEETITITNERSAGVPPAAPPASSRR
ncbi:MAG TPA: DUF4349 domain-containing protein [Thermoanaerobaculia bacterium]|nr:DUF4349 domain-containing protein [Thermoanaerobaculia bacterium]